MLGIAVSIVIDDDSKSTIVLDYNNLLTIDDYPRNILRHCSSRVRLRSLYIIYLFQAATLLSYLVITIWCCGG